MEVSLLADETEEWDDYVLRHPKGSNYHQAKWKTVLENGFAHTTRHLLAKKEHRIVGILPLAVVKSLLFGRFLVSLPFFNYGGIVADDRGVEVALLTAARVLAKDEDASHIRISVGRENAYCRIGRRIVHYDTLTLGRLGLGGRFGGGIETDLVGSLAIGHEKVSIPSDRPVNLSDRTGWRFDTSVCVNVGDIVIGVVRTAASTESGEGERC